MRLNTLLLASFSLFLSSACAGQLPATASDLVSAAEQYRDPADSYVLHGRIKTLQDGCRTSSFGCSCPAAADRCALRR